MFNRSINEVLFEVKSNQEVEDASQRVLALVRTAEANWEDDPDVTPGLLLLKDLRGVDGAPMPVGFRDDKLDIRLFFDWSQGSFDPINFLSFGWTTAPRVRRLVVDYLAETRVDLEEDIIE